MTITGLISKLQKLKSEFGDLDVAYSVNGHDMGDYFNNIKEVIYTKDNYFHRYIIALK
jgi:hypothetical protein